jgi:hypothetical protein
MAQAAGAAAQHRQQQQRREGQRGSEAGRRWAHALPPHPDAAVGKRVLSVAPECLRGQMIAHSCKSAYARVCVRVCVCVRAHF